MQQDTFKMNVEFVKTILENLPREEAIEYIAIAITNRDDVIKNLREIAFPD